MARGCPWKQKVTVEPATTAIIKKLKYFNYSDPTTKDALHEARDYYVTHKKYLTSSEVNLSWQPLIVSLKSTIRHYAQIRANITTTDSLLPSSPCLNSGGNLYSNGKEASWYMTTTSMQQFIRNTINF